MAAYTRTAAASEAATLHPQKRSQPRSDLQFYCTRFTAENKQIQITVTCLSPHTSLPGVEEFLKTHGPAVFKTTRHKE